MLQLYPRALGVRNRGFPNHQSAQRGFIFLLHSAPTGWRANPFLFISSFFAIRSSVVNTLNPTQTKKKHNATTSLERCKHFLESSLVAPTTRFQLSPTKGFHRRFHGTTDDDDADDGMLSGAKPRCKRARTQHFSRRPELQD